MINTKRRALSNEKVSKHEEQTKKLKTDQNKQKVLKSNEPKAENPQKQTNKDKKATKSDLKQKVPQVKEHYEPVKTEAKVVNQNEGQKVNKNKKPKSAKSKTQKQAPALFIRNTTKKAPKIKEEKKESKAPVKLPVLEGLELGYVVCEPEKRFMLLHTFLKKQTGKNVCVLFSNIHSVKFFESLATQLGLNTVIIDENDSQEKKHATLKEASEANTPVFLRSGDATLDLFKDIKLDWLIQYEPHVDAHAYLNLSNQVIKNAPETAKSLLFLLPTDLGYLRYLGESKVEFKEFEFPNHKLINIQSECEKLIKKNFYLNCAARDAFRSYIQGYVSHPLPEIFDAKKVDLEKVVKSFGLDQLVHVHLDDTSNKKPYQIGRKKIFGDNNN